MSHVSRTPLYLLVFLLALSALEWRPARAGDGDWKPVDPAHLALKQPVVERDADAEAIFWEVKADDGGEQDFVLAHYIRVKIFTERGRESQSTVELPYWSGTSIKDVAARTIKPSGEIAELKKSDVFDKTLVKAGGLKIKAKTFALPGVEPARSSSTAGARSIPTRRRSTRACNSSATSPSSRSSITSSRRA